MKNNFNFIKNLDLSVGVLDLIIKITYNNFSFINQKDYKRLNKFCDKINIDDYINKKDIYIRLKIIKSLLKIKNEFKISDKTIIQEKIIEENNLDRDFIREAWEEIDEVDYLELHELDFVNKYVSERLLMEKILTRSKDFMDYYNKALMTDYNDFNGYMNGFINFINSFSLDIKEINYIKKSESMDFGNDTDSLLNMIKITKNEMDSPTTLLKTKMQMFNRMLGGGFESGRVYIFLGKYKGGKSTTILNILLQIFNDLVERIDNQSFNKKPCILYITQENDAIETLQRISSYYFGVIHKLNRNHPEETLNKLNEYGFNDEKVYFKILYRKSKSLNTQDVDNIIDEIEEEGYKVVCVGHDYIKRIKSAFPSPELRIEYANIVDEFSIIAKTRKMVVINAMQINREGVRKAEELKVKGEKGIIMNINGSYIGESQGIIENADCAIVILKETDNSENLYMSFLNVASRTLGIDEKGQAPLPYFSQPYRIEGEGVYNQMHLMEDSNLVQPYGCFLRNVEEAKTTQIQNNVERTKMLKNSILGNPIKISNDFGDAVDEENFNLKEEVEVELREPVFIS